MHRLKITWLPMDSGQKPSTSHRADDGQYRKQTTGVITHLLSLPCYLRHHL